MSNDGSYNPSRVVFTIGGPAGVGGVAVQLPGIPPGVQFPIAIASGRGPDSHVTAARSTDTWTVTVGVDGDATHSRSNNKSGTMALVLTDGSGYNSAISFLQIMQEDETVPDFTVEVTIMDTNATPPSVMAGNACRITRPADYEAGATAGTTTWGFLPTDLAMFHNGRVS